MLLHERACRASPLQSLTTSISTQPLCMTHAINKPLQQRTNICNIHPHPHTHQRCSGHARKSPANPQLCIQCTLQRLHDKCIRLRSQPSTLYQEASYQHAPPRPPMQGSAASEIYRVRHGTRIKVTSCEYHHGEKSLALSSPPSPPCVHLHLPFP